MRKSPVLIVPGWTNSGPDHWQSIWERKNPGWIRVEQSDWDRPERSAWVSTLIGAVSCAPAPPILIAHSLGAVTVAAMGASRPDLSVAGAFLVAPADVERPGRPEELAGFAPMPLARLAFPSVVVASRNDPYLEYSRAQVFAAAWGAELIDAGSAGHINTAAGFGPWPDGEHFLASHLRPEGST